MNLGSTPSRSPARKMIQSRSQSPDCGMSAGIVSTSIGVAETAGANAGLNQSPVKLVKQKSEMTAKGANLAERKWGMRGNFISSSPCELLAQRAIKLILPTSATHGRY